MSTPRQRSHWHDHSRSRRGLYRERNVLGRCFFLSALSAQTPSGSPAKKFPTRLPPAPLLAPLPALLYCLHNTHFTLTGQHFGAVDPHPPDANSQRLPRCSSATRRLQRATEVGVALRSGLPGFLLKRAPQCSPLGQQAGAIAPQQTAGVPHLATLKGVKELVEWTQANPVARSPV